MQSEEEELDIVNPIYLGIVAVDDDHYFHCQTPPILCSPVLFVANQQGNQLPVVELEERCVAALIEQYHVEESAAVGFVQMRSLDVGTIVYGSVDLEDFDLYWNDVPGLKTAEKQMFWDVPETGYVSVAAIDDVAD